jgi:hypothetical protein
MPTRHCERSEAIHLFAKTQASASFLKKRSKKLLIPLARAGWTAIAQMNQKFFAELFFKKATSYSLV